MSFRYYKHSTAGRARQGATARRRDRDEEERRRRDAPSAGGQPIGRCPPRFLSPARMGGGKTNRQLILAILAMVKAAAG